MSQFQLITFDLDNTLWNVVPTLIKAEQTLSKWIKTNHPAAGEHYNLTAIQNIRIELVTTHPELQHNLTELRKRTLHAFFQQAGYSESQASEHANASFEIFYNARNEVTYYPGALRCLNRLAKKYTLGALSNGNANIEKVGLNELMSFHFSAESVGHPKPHRAMFDRALAINNHSPDKCLHIGDHPREDILAAQDLGFSTLWINFDKKAWPLDQPPGAELAHWDDCETTISNLENR